MAIRMLALLLLGSLAHAAPLLDDLGGDPAGRLHTGAIEWTLYHFAPGWQSAPQMIQFVDATRTETATSKQWTGTYATQLPLAPTFDFQQTLTAESPDVVRYEATFKHAEGLPTEQLALQFNLPVYLYVGIPLTFGEQVFTPGTEPFQETVTGQGLRRLILPTPDYRLVFEGPLNAQMQDGRNFADKRHFRLRILAEPSGGTIRSAAIAFTIRREAYTAADPSPKFGEAGSSTIQADDVWRPIEQPKFTVPGSALDWSAWTEPGAGQRGPVVIRDGHLELRDRPGEKLRLFGTNFCDRCCYQDPEACRKLAHQIRAMGYNTVRLHHYDRHLVYQGKAAADGFDPAKLDQLDAMFAALKAEGLYVTIDLYTVRPLPAGIVPGIDRSVWLGEYKALVAIEPTAMADWETFARQLLTHVNPYTGLAWKDDPALWGICLLNENNLTANWNSAPDIAQRYRDRFAVWQTAHGAGLTDPQAWAAFLLERQQATTRHCAEFVRKLGTTALLTDINYRQESALALIREDLDYVDNHAYHDLKSFMAEQWKLPYRHRQTNAVREAASLPKQLFESRISGKPYTVTEFNYCYPNHYRAAGGLLMGAYASLQDWDGIFRYAYAHNPQHANETARAFYLDTATDPLNLLADRMIALLYRRGDVSPAPTMAAMPYDESLMKVSDPLDRTAGFAPETFRRLGLTQRIGMSRAAKAIPPEASLTGPYVSETGELQIDPAAGTFRVVTPRSEGLVTEDAAPLTANLLTLSGAAGFTVAAVGALDDQPLATSRRMLAIVLTDVQNTNVRFGDPEHTILLDWGQLPHLVRRATATLSLKLDGAVTVYALGLDGARLGEVAVESQGGQVVVPVDTARAMAYEVVR